MWMVCALATRWLWLSAVDDLEERLIAWSSGGVAVDAATPLLHVPPTALSDGRLLPGDITALESEIQVAWADGRHVVVEPGIHASWGSAEAATNAALLGHALSEVARAQPELARRCATILTRMGCLLLARNYAELRAKYNCWRYGLVLARALMVETLKGGSVPNELELQRAVLVGRDRLQSEFGSSLFGEMRYQVGLMKAKDLIGNTWAGHEAANPMRTREPSWIALPVVYFEQHQCTSAMEDALDLVAALELSAVTVDGASRQPWKWATGRSMLLEAALLWGLLDTVCEGLDLQLRPNGQGLDGCHAHSATSEVEIMEGTQALRCLAVPRFAPGSELATWPFALAN